MARLTTTPYARVSVLLMACFFAVSCATNLVNIPHTRASSIQKYLKKGDTVLVQTKSNKQVQFTIKEITADRVIGSKNQVLIQDINSIQHIKTDKRKTLIKSGLTVVWVLAVATVRLVFDALTQKH